MPKTRTIEINTTSPYMGDVFSEIFSHMEDTTYPDVTDEQLIVQIINRIRALERRKREQDVAQSLYCSPPPAVHPDPIEVASIVMEEVKKHDKKEVIASRISKRISDAINGVRN